MADLSRIIEIVFGGRNEVGPAVRAALNDIETFDSGVQALAAPLARVADSVLALDAALLVVGATLGGIAFNEAVKYESVLGDLRKQLDETDPPIETLQASIKALALEFGISATDLTAATADIKQAGFDASESLELLEQSIRLSIAGSVDQADATDFLIRILKGYKAEVSDASRIVDIISAATNAYATNATELGEGLKRLSPVAKALNLSYEDTADLLIGVIEVFGSGEEAADALKTGLLSLLTPTKEAEAILEKMGVSTKTASGELRNGRDVVFDFAKAFVTLTGEQQAQVAATIFGKDQAVRLIEAFNGLGKQTINVAEAMGRVASVQDEINIKMASTQKTIDRAVVAFQELAKTVGLEYRDALKGVIGATGDFAIALDKAVNAGAFDELFDLIRPQLKALEDLIRDVAKNLPAALEGVDFTNVVRAFENLGGEIGDVFRAFFGEIDLRSVEGLQSALQKTADTFAALINVTSGIIKELEPFFAAIGRGVDSFAALDAAAQQDLGRVLGIAKLLTDAGVLLGGALVAVGNAGIEMSKVIDFAFGLVKLGINVLQTAFDALALKIFSELEDIYRGLSKITFGDLSKSLAEQADKFAELGDAIQENLTRNAEEADEGLRQLTGAFDDANPKYQVAKDRLNEVGDSLKNLGKTSEDTEKPIEISALAMKAAADQAAFFAASAVETEKKLDTLADQYTDFGSVIGNVAKGVTVQNDKIQTLDGSTAKFIKTTEGGLTVYTQVGNAFQNQSKSTEELSKATEEAKRNSAEFLIEWEKIQSTERIAFFEAAVDFKIAELEADAQKVEAIFENLNTVFESTGQVIGDAFGVLSDFTDKQSVLFGPASEVFELAIKQIELENELRQQAAEDARRLRDAEIDLIEAKVNALNRGDALIKIDGAGLEPELNAFMFKILENIQIRANAEMQEFLLGLPPAS